MTARSVSDRLRQCIHQSRATYVPGTPERYPNTELRGLTVLEAEELVARLEAAEADNRRWLAWSGGDYPDDSPGDVISADKDGTIVLDDGITTWNPLRALAHMEAQVARLQERVRDSEEERTSLFDRLATAEAQVAALTQERDALDRERDAGWRTMVEQRDRAEAAEAALADTRRALADGARIAAQYLDTGRGDLDGWIDRARALAATGGDVPAGEAAAVTAPTTEGCQPISESSAPAGQEQQP